MFMKKIIQGFCVLCLCVYVGIVCSDDSEKDFDSEVFLITADNITGDIFVGGYNVVYRLNASLNLLQNTSLKQCLPNDFLGCKNQTGKVLVLEIDYVFRQLFVCWTESLIRCAYLDLQNITKRKEIRESGSGNKQFNATEIMKSGTVTPIINFVSYPSFVTFKTSRLVVASSNDPQRTELSPSVAVLSVTEIWDMSDGFSIHYLSNYNHSSPYDYYKLTTYRQSVFFKFVDAFCFENECFLISLQHENLTTPTIVSRFASICTDVFFPYVEGTIKAQTNGSQVYDRVLAANLGTVGISLETIAVVVLVMGTGVQNNSPDVDNSKGFAIVMKNLSALKKKIEEVKFFCGFAIETVVPDWINGSFHSCIQEPVAMNGRCGFSANPVIRSLNKEPFLPDHIFPGDVSLGSVTSVFTHTAKRNGNRFLDDRMTIYITFSSGHVKKLHSRWYTDTSFTIEPIPDSSSEMKLSNVRDFRSDLAVTNDYYYWMFGKKVVRTSLDHCQVNTKCTECYQTLGCGWCKKKKECHLEAHCPKETCSLAIESFSPVSGPTKGGTILTVNGTGFDFSTSVYVCNRTCTILNNDTQKNGTMQCMVPEEPSGLERTCNVSVTAMRLDVSANDSNLHPLYYSYKIPRVNRSEPANLPLTADGLVIVYGENLQIGSSVTVTIGEEKCMVNSTRKGDRIECILKGTPFPRNTGNLDSRKCGNVSVTIDHARELQPTSGHNQLCRYIPVIESIQPNWTLYSGQIPIRIIVQYLGLVNISKLGIRLQPDQGQPLEKNCVPCVTAPNNVTCLDCCTPDVTDLVGSRFNKFSVGVFFETKSDKGMALIYTPVNHELLLVPDPVFKLSKFPGTNCSSDVLHLEGSSIPDISELIITVDKMMCTNLKSTSLTTLSCNLVHILPNFSLPKSPCEETKSLEHSNKIWVYVRGRRFPVVCTDPIAESKSNGIFLSVVAPAAGVGGGVVLLVVCVVGCLVYVRQKKKKALKRRNYVAQNSYNSGNILVVQSLPGSAESTHLTLDQLLEQLLESADDKDRKSQLLIDRKFLTLGNTIGTGNFGCVYQGYLQTSPDYEPELVAVKTLLDTVIHMIDLRRFLQEALLMKDFDHPHVLGLLGLAEGDQGLPLVVLPYMSRGDLLSYVKDQEKCLTVGDVMRFACDIASGMEYLSSRKLVHRDLAARNCMLDDRFRVKVADFGLCRDVYEKGYYHSDNKQKLPIRWMAMESIEKGTYNLKTDVWSFAVVIWEMTTRGTTPYPGVEGWDILRYLHTGRRLDPPLVCPEPLYSLMCRCWHEDPRERPTFRDLERGLHNMTLKLTSPTFSMTSNLATKITFPECRRFRNEEDIVEQFISAIRKMSFGAAIATKETPELSIPDKPVEVELPERKKEVASPSGSPRRYVNVPKQKDSGLPVNRKEATGSGNSSESRYANLPKVQTFELQDRRPSKRRSDKGYYVLER